MAIIFVSMPHVHTDKWSISIGVVDLEIVLYPLKFIPEVFTASSYLVEFAAIASDIISDIFVGFRFSFPAKHINANGNENMFVKVIMYSFFTNLLHKGQVSLTQKQQT